MPTAEPGEAEIARAQADDDFAATKTPDEAPWYLATEVDLTASAHNIGSSLHSYSPAIL